MPFGVTTYPEALLTVFGGGRSRHNRTLSAKRSPERKDPSSSRIDLIDRPKRKARRGRVWLNSAPGR